jgi:DNA-binding NtrC family response regulator
VNLLRVLQDGTLRRLGSETSIRVDVRIVAATHRDLLAMVREGSFREDLYYRLQGATLPVPALRERKSDLKALVTHFLGELGSGLRVTRECWQLLEAYTWPGNVRELRAEVNRWHVFCDQWVRPADLDPKFSTPSASSRGPAATVATTEPLAKAVALAEREAIATALSAAKNNLSRAARILAIDRNTLKRKIRKHEISFRALPTGRPADEW